MPAAVATGGVDPGVDPGARLPHRQGRPLADRALAPDQEEAGGDDAAPSRAPKRSWDTWPLITIPSGVPTIAPSTRFDARRRVSGWRSCPVPR